jgi:glycine/D-amino acid oxidase-like deaminating enzyme
VVRDMGALRLEAVDWIERLVGQLDLDCAFARRRLHTCMSKDEHASLGSLQEEFDAAAEARLGPNWIPTGHLPLYTIHGFAIDGQAQFNPYVRSLAEAAARRGVRVHEDSAVLDVDASAGTVTTARGKVRAQRIVLATHTPIGINLVQAEMPVYRECGIGATLAQDRYPEGIFWVRDASRSVRSYHALDHDYLMVVGEMHKLGHEEPAQFIALEEYARKHFQVADVTHTWSAQQYRSADGLPYIGPGGHDNVFLATGFAADGLTWGTVAARIIGELIAGQQTAASERLTPRRFTPLKSAREWVAESRVVFDHLVIHRLKKENLKGLSDLRADEGHLIEIDADKYAAYRSPGGTAQRGLGGVRAHECQVHWNPMAKSWDCPWHGSRFRVDGSVIEGPALHPLERLQTTPD